MTERDYDHYLANLAGKRPPIHANEPQCGYYKRNFERDGPFVAAAIWRNPTGELVCRVGNNMADPRQQWVRLARHPIEEAKARAWFETGLWPGEDAKPYAAAEEIPFEPLDEPAVEPAAATSDGEPRPNADAADPAQALLERFEEALASTEAWVKPGAAINDEKQATLVGNKIGTLRELAGELTDHHKVVKKPHWDECKRLDDLFLKPAKKLDEIVATLRRISTTYMVAEEEKRRKAAEEAQKAAEAAKESGEPVNDDAPPFDVDPPAPVRIGGDTGRALSLRTISDVEITDIAKVFRKFKEHPDVIALLSKLAHQSLKTGSKVPGAKLTEKKVAA